MWRKGILPGVPRFGPQDVLGLRRSRDRAARQSERGCLSLSMIWPTPNIPGAQEISARLGRWPSFHDAEILDFHVVRGGESSVTIDLGNVGIAVFTLRGVVDLDVGGEMVDHQNVIFDLHVEKVEAGTKLTFAPCYGFVELQAARSCTARSSDM